MSGAELAVLGADDEAALTASRVFGPFDLDALAEQIRRDHQRGRDAVVVALDAQLSIGHALSAARRLLPSNQAFGVWFKAQAFGFNQQRAHKLRQAAELEPEIRATCTRQLVNGSGINVEAALRTITATAGRAEDQRARETTLDALTVDSEGDRWRMLAGDFRERLMELPRGSVDLMVADGPYPTEFLPLFSDLSKAAAHVLADDGICVVLCGTLHFREVGNRLAEHLNDGWVYVQPLPGANSRILGRHVLQSHKLWWAFSKGPWPSGRVRWHADMLDVGARVKNEYRWQQDGAPAKLLMEELCPEGGTICDPFAGTGAYGVAAIEVGRRFIGVELDSSRFEMAAQNLRGAVARPAESDG